MLDAFSQNELSVSRTIRALYDFDFSAALCEILVIASAVIPFLRTAEKEPRSSHTYFSMLCVFARDLFSGAGDFTPGRKGAKSRKVKKTNAEQIKSQDISPFTIKLYSVAKSRLQIRF